MDLRDRGPEQATKGSTVVGRAVMRRAGVLLHISSLPGPYGVGDLGPSTGTWLRWLESAGQTVWQTLPLTPVDGIGCPYASPSAMAGEPLLLSPQRLVEDGWLTADEAAPRRRVSEADLHVVDWPRVREAKLPALIRAAERVAKSVDLDAWSTQHPWVVDWALFSALSRVHGDDWPSWPESLRDRSALDDAREVHEREVRIHMALQWLFDGQWARVRAEAASHGIEIWGDLPFYVGASSCDTWAHPELFALDGDRRPRYVSGVPPDAFSALGQLWGHAVYDVDAHRASEHRWWRQRAGVALRWFDRVRIDHFRGIAAGWWVEAGALDARGGSWVPGLGAPLLGALTAEFGRDRWLAEDLGVITPDVEALRKEWGLPGMSVLQFAFGEGAGNLYLPHNITPDRVAYTGTHDNDTAVGWFASLRPAEREFVRRYLMVDGKDIHEDLVRWAYRTPAVAAIAPLQDLLGLGSAARMNVPGTDRGNWRWRSTSDVLKRELAACWAVQARVTGRCG